MSVSFISVKCPACGASFNAEEDREFSFCTYCGSKIMTTNDNEHIYRNIDEARIKEAETDRMVRMRELEMEEKSNISRKYLIIAWIAGSAFLLFLGIIGMSVDNPGLGMCMLIGMCVAMWGGIGLFGNKKKKRRYTSSSEVMISDSMERFRCRDKNYNSIYHLYTGAGFINVKAVALHDLTMFNQRKNGQVESVTINGSDDFEEGDIFPKSANVLITYHSK